MFGGQLTTLESGQVVQIDFEQNKKKNFFLCLYMINNFFFRISGIIQNGNNN